MPFFSDTVSCEWALRQNEIHCEQGKSLSHLASSPVVNKDVFNSQLLNAQQNLTAETYLRGFLFKLHHFADEKSEPHFQMYDLYLASTLLAFFPVGAFLFFSPTCH